MKTGLLKQNKGMTLVELVVAMSIFLVVMTIAVGAFVSLLRLQSQSETMTSVQQNARTALEQITRLSRQAEKVEFKSGNLKLALSEPRCFNVVDGSLKRYNGYGDNGCTGDGFSVTSDDVDIITFDFKNRAGIPPTLEITLEVRSKNAAVGTSNDTISLKTAVLLTGVK